MADIHIERDHTLGLERAKAKAETLAQALQRKLDVSYRWKGNTLYFKRSGARGKVEVSDTHLRLDLSLGVAFRLMKTKIESTIEEQLDRALNEPGSKRTA